VGDEDPSRVIVKVNAVPIEIGGEDISRDWRSRRGGELVFAKRPSGDLVRAKRQDSGISAFFPKDANALQTGSPELSTLIAASLFTAAPRRFRMSNLGRNAGSLMKKIGADMLRWLAMGFTLLFGTAGTIPGAAAEEPMSFQLVTLGSAHCQDHCPQVVFAQGQIDEAAAGNLLRFVHDNLGGEHLHGVVLLDSPGGHVVAAMELGLTIRKLGMAVIVARPGGQSAQDGSLFSGHCYSACVYALMGGKKRVIPPQSRVGVHRMFNYTTSFSLADGGFVRERYLDDGDMRRRLAHYTRAMGVDSTLIDLAERTSPDFIHVLTPAEILRWRLGTQRL
jgi:hypothetical protein